MKNERTFSRRFVLGTGLTLSAFALAQSIDPNTRPPETQPAFTVDAVSKKITEIIDTKQLPDEDVISVFTGRNAQLLKPFLYALPATIGVHTDGPLVQSEIYQPDFSDFGEHNTKINTHISFSPEWYELKSDIVQRQAMQFAANTVLQMPIYSRFQAFELEKQGKYIMGDTDKMLRINAANYAMDLLRTDERQQKLFDYAPYILLMQTYQNMNAEMDLVTRLDFDKLLPRDLRTEVQARNITTQNFAVNSLEYAELAFGNNKWTELVEEL